MPVFTLELRQLIENYGVDLPLNDYPIYDEAHRQELNDKIINHYWYYEIGHETIDQFLRQLRTKMHEIMPPINQLYESAALKYDPLLTQDVTTESSQESTGEAHNTGRDTATERGTADATNTAKSEAISSEMPQTRLSGDENYATAATNSANSGGSQSVTTGDRTGETTSDGSTASRGSALSHVKGYSGTSAASLVAAYRETILNIDMMVVDSLSELFMGLWNNSDEYTGRRFGFYGYF